MEKLPIDQVHVETLLREMIEGGCRELHLRIGQSPYTRFCDGHANETSLEYQALRPLDCQQMVYAILTDEQIHQLEREGELAFSYSAGSYFTSRKVRFGVRVFHS
jgi:Tfp pilus assembly pilus retraction ATPase PilT